MSISTNGGENPATPILEATVIEKCLSFVISYRAKRVNKVPALAGIMEAVNSTTSLTEAAQQESVVEHYVKMLDQHNVLEVCAAAHGG